MRRLLQALPPPVNRVELDLVVDRARFRAVHLRATVGHVHPNEARWQLLLARLVVAQPSAVECVADHGPESRRHAVLHFQHGSPCHQAARVGRSRIGQVQHAGHLLARHVRRQLLVVAKEQQALRVGQCAQHQQSS